VLVVPRGRNEIRHTIKLTANQNDTAKFLDLRFVFVGLVPDYTSDWLKSFCEKYHPEINFDRELETHKPGVFARYHDKFGYDYIKVSRQETYNKLKEALGKKGYELPWE
jgi:alkyl hydroperoxide reductase subunit AhpF